MIKTKTNLYEVLKNKQSKEVNDFPIMFAFNQKQFNEGMIRLKLDIIDTDKIYNIGHGGYIKKTVSKAFNEMFENNEKEMNEAIAEDKTGDGFIYDMFKYELGNHEYCYTYSVEQTLESLDMTIEQVQENPILLYALRKACQDCKNEDED